MQPNLQATTFNKHNRIKDEFKNYRQNQFVNRISSDLSFHAKSITNVKRNVFNINAGNEYLYIKRIENLKRMLNSGKITYEQYIIAVQKIELKMFGEITTHPINEDDQKLISNDGHENEQSTNDAIDESINEQPTNSTNDAINEQSTNDAINDAINESTNEQPINE